MNRSAHTAAEDDGLLPHCMGLVSAFIGYFKVRLQLAGLEGKEAGTHYLGVLALLVGAMLAAIFGYFFLVLAAVFLLAWALGDGHSWIWVSLGMALLHFLGAAAFVLFAKNRFAQPVFQATFVEFRKDQEWLTSKTEKTY